jgi:hypothetical protein
MKYVFFGGFWGHAGRAAGPCALSALRLAALVRSFTRPRGGAVVAPPLASTRLSSQLEVLFWSAPLRAVSSRAVVSLSLSLSCVPAVQSSPAR